MNPGSHIHNFLGFVSNTENTEVFVCARVLWINLALMLGMASSFC